MKRFNTFETQLESAVDLSDKAKLSLYKKSSNSGISIDVLEEVYHRGYSIWNESFGGTADSFAFDRVNSFIAGGFAAELDDDLLEKRGLWDNIHAKRARIKAGSGERMRKPGSEGAPTDAALKASQNEDADPCWKGYKMVGMKKKGGRTVPNCVPVKEEEIEEGKIKDKLQKVAKVGALAGALGAHAGKLYDVTNVATHSDDPGMAAATVAAYAHPASRVLQAAPSILKVNKLNKGENEFERQKKYPKKTVKEEDAEKHSQNPDNPMSRFDASTELVNIYAKDTPGQIVKRVVKEATFQGKQVPLNKPMKGDVKKSKVFVDPDGDGKAQKVNFGDKNMSIKKDQPGRKKSYCARSGGIKGTSDKTSANYWSRRAWDC
jgi:hypothetical protein